VAFSSSDGEIFFLLVALCCCRAAMSTANDVLVIWPVLHIDRTVIKIHRVCAAEWRGVHSSIAGWAIVGPWLTAYSSGAMVSTLPSPSVSRATESGLRATRGGFLQVGWGGWE